MASVFSRLIVKNPLGVALEGVLFLLAISGVVVLLVGAAVTPFLSSETWSGLVAALPGFLPDRLLQLAEQAGTAPRVFLAVVSGFALVLLSALLGALYNGLLAPFLRQRNVTRLERLGFQPGSSFQAKGELALLDPEHRYAFFVTAARALRIHADEVQKMGVRSLPLARQHQFRVDLTDPQTPNHELLFKSKDECDALRTALRQL